MWGPVLRSGVEADPKRNRTGQLLRRAIRAVWRGGQRNAAGDDCGTILEQVAADLASLNHATEKDFLAIGGKLAEFLAAARQISADMAALGELISGSTGCHASQVLTRVLERLRETQARAETGDRTLGSACDSARQIGRTFSGFRDTVSIFRVLGSLTRIETARLGHAGAEFGHLAEEVNALTQSIETSGQGIVDDSAILHGSMRSALTKVTDLRAGELKELPSLIAEVMTSLASLENRRRRASEASLRQAAEYAEASAAIGDLITAIQFHDITRQQVEHVVEALRGLRAEFREGVRKRVHLPRDARAVLTLQSSQLSSAEQVFARSAAAIQRDLDSIAGRVRNMAEAGQTLLGFSAEERDSFFLQMEGRFTAILRVVGTCATAEAETRSVLAELEQTVARMQQSVAEVRHIGIRIHRIAINAAIRAVPIGDSGNALNLIAEVMQRLALDSASITGEVAAALEAIADAAGRLSSRSAWTVANAHSDADTSVSEMRAAILELHSSSEASFGRLNQITALSSRLGDEIQSVRAGFSAGALFAETAGRVRRALEQIGGQFGPAPRRDLEAPAERRLEDFALHYTMQAEREVHASVTAGAAPGQPVPVGTSTVVPDEQDFGDNVELF